MGCGFQRALWLAVATAAALAVLRAQMPGPPHGGPPHGRPPFPPDSKWMEQRITEVEGQLHRQRAADAELRELLGFAGRYLDQARKSLKEGNVFMADRLTAAADDCQRPVEILSRSDTDDVRPRPPRGFAGDPLRRVYFRLRLCDFFLDHIPDPKPQRLLAMARSFYRQALQANEVNDTRRTMEYAISADVLTHAIENVAQIYAPMPPPGPPPPRRPPQ